MIMKIITDYLNEASVDKEPLPEYTGEGITFDDSIFQRCFNGTFNSRQVLQIVRMREENKIAHLSRWKMNTFSVIGFWEVRVWWHLGWKVKFITNAEGCIN
ncbi:MAG: hypothetical protein US30_C0013G0057 [Candidatus Moranbacteria bacterium GW2011_GWF2_36_839]|nr:MAG: hypothetical protein US27_C0013G0057 [Candidatus Moranbacteria bacterium GW2011_GWF1_36_78]KKQ16660.1 MAG: hypothetical protein US30_C0013G0057 [Candidatus Moranbacteria bacterium GW2011_GWF2_36_839]